MKNISIKLSDNEYRALKAMVDNSFSVCSNSFVYLRCRTELMLIAIIAHILLQDIRLNLYLINARMGEEVVMPIKK